MEKNEIKAKIIGIMSNLFQNSDVDTDVLKYVDLIDDLGMDSVNFISLIIELEAEFDIQIQDDQLLMDKFREYSSIYSIVEELLMSKEKEVSVCKQ
ncbi:putative peptide synthetase [Candidatus Colimorpha enterica]|uniref:Putative peptide synthetase n=1 Tax=Candidatus Colimorpha enterica TaxID=3083063 RepID=R6TRR9_9BACT|nr:putative peptide synthetase [Candidatus Colimorpha enterica]